MENKPLDRQIDTLQRKASPSPRLTDMVAVSLPIVLDESYFESVSNKIRTGISGTFIRLYMKRLIHEEKITEEQVKRMTREKKFHLLAQNLTIADFEVMAAEIHEIDHIVLFLIAYASYHFHQQQELENAFLLRYITDTQWQQLGRKLGKPHQTLDQNNQLNFEQIMARLKGRLVDEEVLSQEFGDELALETDREKIDIYRTRPFRDVCIPAVRELLDPVRQRMQSLADQVERALVERCSSQTRGEQSTSNHALHSFLSQVNLSDPSSYRWNPGVMWVVKNNIGFELLRDYQLRYLGIVPSESKAYSYEKAVPFLEIIFYTDMSFQIQAQSVSEGLLLTAPMADVYGYAYEVENDALTIRSLVRSDTVSQLKNPHYIDIDLSQLHLLHLTKNDNQLPATIYSNDRSK